MMRRTIRQRNGGYILVETVVALVLLSIGAYAIHGAMRQAIVARGQAQDYTHARYLLEKILAEIELQPLVKEETRAGVADAPHERFSWELAIDRVDLPLPPGAAPYRDGEGFRYPRGLDYLGRVRATVRWERAGRQFTESIETLLPPRKLYQPPEPI